MASPRGEVLPVSTLALCNAGALLPNDLVTNRQNTNVPALPYQLIVSCA